MEDERLKQYIALCKRIYERMEQEGSWPWRDSQDSKDEVESDSDQKGV
jgi:hypothetical protein